eukprot:jgi/Picre1/28822/NNA_004219.t1
MNTTQQIRKTPQASPHEGFDYNNHGADDMDDFLHTPFHPAGASMMTKQKKPDLVGKSTINPMQRVNEDPKYSIHTEVLRDVLGQIDELRRKNDETDAKFQRSVQHLVSMHDWATKTTTKVRELEDKLESATKATKKAEAEVLRLQELISKSIQQDTTRTKRKKRSKTNAPKYSKSESSGV